MQKLNIKRADTKLYLLLSFFVPMLLVFICWIFMGVYPFGDRQILVTDFWHQYYPFANILHGKLHDLSSSFLYTWESGMGSNFLAMMAYYAASPLNLLTILAPEAFLREAITLILLLKIGCAGLFTGMFLRYTFRRNDITIACFAVLYALCSYIIGYYWNTIWIDTVALLPLVTLGTVKLVREGKCALFIPAFALALISNYYIGLFICVFEVIAFFCIFLFEGRGAKHFFKSGFKMLGSALTGLAISAFMLLPAYFALQLTNSADNTFPTVTEWYESWFDILANMTAFREPTTKEGLPNLYCGIICIVLLGMFLRSGEIRIREKVAAVLVLSFILISCNMNKLNFIWHGFHFTNMLPYRFSFLFSFIMVVVAYRAFTLVLKGRIKLADCIAMLLIAGGAFAVTWVSERTEEQTTAMWMSLAASLFYVVVFFLFERRILKPTVMCMVLSLGIFAEMFLSTRVGTFAVGTSDRKSYPVSYDDVETLLDDVRKEDDSLFYRSEINTWYTLNDPALYSYNGISQFSSMANKNITTYLRKLGVAGSEAGNRYYYGINSPMVNMFTGIKYIVSRTGDALDTATLTEKAVSGSVRLYENNYTLPIGFMTDENILGYEGKAYSNPFEAQNDLFARATGLTEPLFTSMDVTHTSHTGFNEKNGVYRKSYGNYSFACDESASNHTFAFNYVPEEESALYAYFSADGVSNISVLNNNFDIGNFASKKGQGYTTPMGTFKAGEKATISASVTDNTVNHGSLTIYVYKLNQETLEKGYSILSQGGIRLDSFSDREMSGTITASEDGVCYFSIPNDGGWKVYVDGKETETRLIGDAVIGVKLTAGEHELRLKYTPEGFTVGMVLTMAGLAVWVIVLLFERRKRILLQYNN